MYRDIAKLKTSSQALSEEKNKLSNSIKSASAEERPAIIAKSKSVGEELKVEQEKLAAEQSKFDDMMLRMPNMPSPESPVGKDDSENVVRRKVGTPRSFDFTPRDHVELMELNDWSELERITKVCGSRTYAIKNELAKLELAIHMMVIDKLAANGFTVINVPSISKERPLYGQGYLPFSRDEIYYMPEDDIYLSGTAELILNSLRADELLNENELPILYAGFSPCFRREAGAAGKDTRGLTRVHQFMKTEQFVICKMTSPKAKNGIRSCWPFPKRFCRIWNCRIRCWKSAPATWARPSTVSTIWKPGCRLRTVTAKRTVVRTLPTGRLVAPICAIATMRTAGSNMRSR